MLANNIISINTTEDQILRAKKLKMQIDALQKEFDAIKDQLLKTHFANHAEYTDADGCVLATYLPYERNMFMTKEFEKDHPELNKLYSIKNTYHQFRLK